MPQLRPSRPVRARLLLIDRNMSPYPRLGEKPEYYASVDIAKYGLALLVAIIHIQPFGSFRTLLMPFLRAATPLFFMFSAFFLFSKLRLSASPALRRQALGGFCLRTARLYVFWLVVSLPLVLQLHPRISVGDFLFLFFFGEIFPASWFLPALILGAALVSLIPRKARLGVQAGVALGVYALMCLLGGYGNLPGPGWSVALAGAVHADFVPVNSLLMGVPWAMLGKLFADCEPFRRAVTFGGDRVKTLAALGVCVTLAYAEYVGLTLLGWMARSDAIIMLMPICLFAFPLLLTWRPPARLARVSGKLRHMSTVVYCCHDTLYQAAVWSGAVSLLPDTLWYFLILLLCHLVGTALIHLSRLRGFHWVRSAF